MTEEPYTAPADWPNHLKELHSIFDACLNPLAGKGHVYFFAVQGRAFHVAVLPENETFIRPGEIREVDDAEADRIIGSCGALSFLPCCGTMRIFSQKRSGVVLLCERPQDTIPAADEVRSFLFAHMGLSFF